MSAPDTVAAVVIGRNEGARLGACLAALAGQVGRVVYVDSGSTDGSVALARAAGAEVVALDAARPFTAARGRNAGFAALAAGGLPRFVQFVDGDTALAPGWVAAGAGLLADRPGVAVAFGRLRERFPGASAYNRLCDAEWDGPPGPAEACGGIALMRAEALAAAGGFAEDMIAGEEPDLCARLRAAGWEVWRLEAEMGWHDAGLLRFGQWWRRARRAGHAAAEGARRHGGAAERAQRRRALLWSGLLPLGLAGAVLTPWALALWLAFPAQVWRLARRAGGGRTGWERAGLLTLGKLPEALGVLEFYARHLLRRPAGLIEHK